MGAQFLYWIDDRRPSRSGKLCRKRTAADFCWRGLAQ